MMKRIWSLERLVHLALLCTSAVAIYVLLSGRSRSIQEPDRIREQFTTGQFLKPVAADCQGCKHVYLVISSTCRFCLEQKPLYKEMASRLKGRDKMQLRVLATDSKASVQEAFETTGIGTYLVEPDQVPSTLPRGITPVLIVTESDGRIVLSKFGALKKNDEETLFELLGAE